MHYVNYAKITPLCAVVSLYAQYFWNHYWLRMLLPISTFPYFDRECRNHKGDSPIVSVKKMNSCSLFLGIGNLLVWFPLLRYFAYFQSYNILLL
ncbi:Mucolipin-2 [Dermatophagoides farinae]|uniref:Mucolipin-2 n=1 Tax=Dermatophagoides farinae TaxID=6954 RepID=A0A922I318_DERFA|nr:Mucolipin-2 [Dermatophagoides farinae]KAH9518160.1 Mucolipin-2 [Dermatophagoides farinae]